MFKRIFTTLLGLILGFCILGAGVLAVAVLVSYPKLPAMTAFTFVLFVFTFFFLMFGIFHCFL